ncbi:hypothetical protein D3C77_422370 [compost metagenome]
MKQRIIPGGLRPPIIDKFIGLLYDLRQVRLKPGIIALFLKVLPQRFRERRKLRIFLVLLRRNLHAAIVFLLGDSYYSLLDFIKLGKYSW